MSIPDKQDVYDMSAEHVMINFDALLESAGHAVTTAKSQMQRYLSQTEIRPASQSREDMYHYHHHCQFYAREFAEAAQVYAEAWRVYHALYEAKTREKLDIIR